MTVEKNLYSFIDEMCSTQNASGVNLTKYNLDHVDTEDFLRAAAHQITDFIDR